MSNCAVKLNMKKYSFEFTIVFIIEENLILLLGKRASEINELNNCALRLYC